MRFLLLSIFLFLLIGCFQKDTPIDTNLNNSTNISEIPNNQTENNPITPTIPRVSLTEYVNDYLNYHYRPWNYKSPMYTQIESFWGYDQYKKDRGYVDKDLVPYDEAWFNNIFAISNLEEYGKISKLAITIQNTNLRVFPTLDPLFKIAYKGDGYPFDLLQNSFISIMSPVVIFNYSKDKKWAFVETSFAAGWIRSNHLSLVDAKKANTIKKLKHIVITQDNSKIYKNKKLVSNVKIGTVLPMIYENRDFFFLYLLDRNSKKYVAKIDKNSASPLPLEFNEQNIQKIANKLKGESYGWGGINENRDCSALTRDFMSVFSIWLPRNSGAQKNVGEFFNLENFSDQEKNDIIKKYATPYLSLVYLPGHIMLYVGNDGDNALVLHNIWGIRTIKDGVEGREVIGKSIVSDLFLGADLEYADKNNTLIKRVTGFNTIGLTRQKAMSLKLEIAYKDFISNMKDNLVYFKDNSTLIFDDKKDKSYDETLKITDIKDMFRFVYPKGKLKKAPDTDPGRLRNEKFFKKIYGKNKEEIQKNLVEVTWLPKKIGTKILFNKNNNAAKSLQKVSNELDKLDDTFLPYLRNIGGTYNYRKISATDKLSMHSFGIAIDINVEKSRYWQWDKEYKYQNSIPQKIIDIFEKHGFIWGGKWYHYDTMHFEFRPELL